MARPVAESSTLWRWTVDHLWEHRGSRLALDLLFLISCLWVWIEVSEVGDLLISNRSVTALGLRVAVVGVLVSSVLIVGRILRKGGQQIAPEPSSAGYGPTGLESSAERRGDRELFGALGLVLFVFILALGALHLRHQRRHLRATGVSDLEAIANLKVAQFEGWRSERLGDAKFFSQAAFVAADARAFVANPTRPEIRGRLLNWLNLLKGGSRYEDVGFYDAAADLRLYLPDGRLRLPERLPSSFVAMFEEGPIKISDLRHDAATGEARMDLVAPVLGEAGVGETSVEAPLGHLLLRIDPEHLLFPMLQKWPVSSPTAEVLLIRRQGDALENLTRLRHETLPGGSRRSLPDANSGQFAARIEAEGAGAFETLDYRGVPVIAVARSVPGTPWHLVVKKDRSELYTSLKMQAWLTLGLLLVLLAAMILGMRYVWERRARLVDRQRLVLAERIALLMNQANDPILLLRENGEVLEVNQQAMRAYGFTRTEFSQCHWSQLGGQPLPPRSSTTEPGVGTAGARLFEEIHRRKDGTTFPVECSLGAVRIGAKWYWQVILRDISDRKRQEAERKELEARLRHQQKLEAIGTLASGVAHEINNPITGMMNYAQLIVDHPSRDGEIADYAAEIIGESRRVAGIVRGLLQFAHRGHQPMAPARLHDIVESTLSLVRVLFRKDQIAIGIRVSEDLPLVPCRASEIQQVLMNLLTNARDALNLRFPGSHPDKRIEMEGKVVTCDRQPWIRLSVTDRGDGIPVEVRDRVFEPFYTTKSRDKGTGLGLSISHGLVRDHHGVLHFETEIGVGTRFHVDLPLAHGGAATSEISGVAGSDEVKT